MVALRGALAAASLLVSVAAGLVTNVYTDGWRLPWGVALVMLVVVGAGLQVAVIAVEGRGRQAVRAAGAGSVAVGGSVRGPVTTRVRGVDGAAGDVGGGGAAGDGVFASGSGGVAAGGDVHGRVETSVERQTDGRV